MIVHATRRRSNPNDIAVRCAPVQRLSRGIENAGIRGSSFVL